jgi:hypothetical protein
MLPAQPHTIALTHRALNYAAQVFSYLIHPLYLPLAVTCLVLYQHPIFVLVADAQTRFSICAMVFVNTVLIPAVFALLLWRLKFVSNLYLHTQKERIVPLVAGIVFYFWAYYVGRNLEAIPDPVKQWLLGVFLGASAALFMNIFFKISLHCIAIGGAATFMGILSYTDAHWPNHWFSWFVLAAGLVGTARLIKKAHQPAEVYAGYAVGTLCQLGAWAAMPS